jgi:hypothetical protein
MKRIKHNNLLPWFTQDHGTLPASYLASCAEFFQWLEDSKRNGFKAPGKSQAPSKQQATSLTNHESRIIKDLESEK